MGNHEFDNGVSGLTPFIESLTCPVLAANLALSKEPTLLSEPNLMNSVVIDINGTKVGVIGYLTPETKVLTIANNVEYIDEVISLQKEVYRLRNNSVNILIALGHSGFARDLEIAKQVEGLDLVIGGHTNTFLWNGTSPDSEKPEGPYPTLVKQKSGKLVPVVQAFAYTKYLGKLYMVFNASGEIISYDGNPILLDNTVPQDPEVLAIIEKYRDAVNQVSEVVVGNTSIVLDMLSCKVKECNLGNLITDAMIYKYATEYHGEGWTDAPMAVLQRGGIRSSIAHINLPAAVTMGDLLTVLPFDGHMVKLTVNGSHIWKMLEHSVARYKPTKAPGEFLQLSGIKVIYDLKKRPGMRVVKVTLRCGMCEVPEYRVLNRSQEYKILTTSFLAAGGDGYSVFKDLPIEPLSYNELDATAFYLQTHSPVYTAVEDRITLYNVDKMKVNSAATNGLSLVSVLLVLITFKFI